MPHNRDVCSRCGRGTDKVKVGMIILAYTDGKVYKPNVCEPHIKEIARWLMIETPYGHNIKLPKDSDPQKQLRLQSWSS